LRSPLLHLLWHPRSGLIYSTLTSEFELAKRDGIKAEPIDGKSGAGDAYTLMIEAWMSRPPKPEFHACEGYRDLSHVQVHRTLLTLASDARFLQADRMSAWSLDLASSALALRALAWTKRYDIFVQGAEPEVIYLDAMESLMFRENRSEEMFEFLSRAHELGRFKWTLDSYVALICARNDYRALLDSLGIRPSQVQAAVNRCEHIHPIILE
jgi:hypothetical protein